MRYHNKGSRPLIVTFMLVFFMQGCSSSMFGPSSGDPSYRYTQKIDSAPTFAYGDIDYIEPVPAFEKYNVRNNRPYKVMGRYYTPMTTGKGFVQEGKASWYGQKFHGHNTANGEVFDMFELTAAHTTLPLPSFARVTNLENGKVTTVRINDRGPFHGDRILDLSYAAAKKLGFKEKGTSRVRIEVIHIDELGYVTIGNGPTKAPQKLVAKVETLPAPKLLDVNESTNNAADSNETAKIDNQLFVQVLALSDTRRAQNLAKGISDLLQLPTHFPRNDNLYKVQIGPLENEQKARKVIKDLAKIGFNSAFPVILSAN